MALSRGQRREETPDLLGAVDADARRAAERRPGVPSALDAQVRDLYVVAARRPVQARHVGVDAPRAGARAAAVAARPGLHDVAHPAVVVLAAAAIGDDLVRGPVRVDDRDRPRWMAGRQLARAARDG